MVTLGILAYKRYDLLKLCIQSAMSGSVKPDRILIVDNGCKFNKSNYNFDNIEVLSYARNIGVAAGWNKILENSDDITIISNDDIEFGNDTIEKFRDNFNPMLLSYPILPTNNIYSCFSISKLMWEDLGKFDEVFSPAYYEDNDSYIRIVLSNKYHFNQVNSNCKHFGSASIKSYTPSELEKHHKDFRRNRAIYVAKWGGLPNEEKFTVPYNGADPNIILDRIYKQRF